MVILPLDIALADKNANLTEVQRLVARLPEGTDLVVLPELFSTGFIGDADKCAELAEPDNGATISTLASLAAANRCAFAGSFLARDGENLYNRGFFIEPGGDMTFYDKRHLFMLSAESRIFTKGMRISPVIRYRGWNIALSVCYDIRFPVWNRNVDHRYDILVVPANWPDSRAFAWTHLLQARAIENQSYMVGANRGGCDQYGCYADESFVFDYMGRSIANGELPFVTATLSRTDLLKFRSEFPAILDADSFTIHME